MVLDLGLALVHLLVAGTFDLGSFKLLVSSYPQHRFGSVTLQGFHFPLERMPLV